MPLLLLLLPAFFACADDKYELVGEDDTASAGETGAAGDAGADADGDGYTVGEGDCDDGNAAINPGATDIVGDGGDQNCDGVDGYDGDGDGVASDWSGGTDCDDEDPSVSEGTTWYPDEDGDGYGDDARAFESCDEYSDWITRGGDCDDGDSRVNPGADEEGCDGLDNDCDPSTEDFVPGIVAPIIDAVVLSNGGLRDFGGVEYPSVLLDFILSDGDGDLGELILYTWIDGAADGAVDTSVTPTYTSELSVGSGDLCGYQAVTASLYISVGATLTYSTLYEFAVVAEDASGNQSSAYIVSGYTPNADGSDGG